MFSDFISLADLATEDVRGLLDRADDLKLKRKAGETYCPLQGRTVVMIFEKPSLRTRATFEAGIFQLGGQAVFFQESIWARESIPDVARNLERWVDGIVARTHRHEAVVELAEYSSVPVINALTDREHPCQVLADAQTIREHKGDITGLRVAFVGDGNNMLASWGHLNTHFPFDLVHVCPEAYELRGETRAFIERNSKGSFVVTHDPMQGVAGADVVYTDVWTSMGQEAEREVRKKAFAPYQVNAGLMARAKPDAIFMHCLPAHRGEEVTDDVIDGPRSVVFDEAENRLHTHKAIMVELMADRR